MVIAISAARPSVKSFPAFTILTVDDNRDFVEFLKFLLSHDGFNIRWAFDGPDALQSVRDQPVDLVVLDVMMPKMDGLTVCRELKLMRPALPVILLTAKDDIATRTTAMNLGVSDFLAKPVNIEDFLTRIRTMPGRPVGQESRRSLGAKGARLIEAVNPVRHAATPSLHFSPPSPKVT